MLLIGTNDLNQNYDVANAPARLSGLIDHIRTAKPQSEVFVATVPAADQRHPTGPGQDIQCRDSRSGGAKGVTRPSGKDVRRH